MGDISAEPSMEEILSSIKRIIAEEGDTAIGTRTRRPPRPSMPPRHADSALHEVLELSDPVADAEPLPPMQPDIASLETFPMTMGSPTPSESPAASSKPTPPAEPILSPRAEEATRGPLEALSRMVVKPETPGSDTLEGMVRELLKPMLRDWLDANLPQIVESMVAREISRITGRD